MSESSKSHTRSEGSESKRGRRGRSEDMRVREFEKPERVAPDVGGAGQERVEFQVAGCSNGDTAGRLALVSRTRNT